MDFAAKMWTRLGTPKEKLVIGMPTYGRSFTLADRSKYVVNSPTTGGGTAGEFTREAGFLGEALLSDLSAQWALFHVCKHILDIFYACYLYVSVYLLHNQIYV